MTATLAAPMPRTMPDVAQTDRAHEARRAVGDVTRRAILRELARREAAREPAPSWADLAAATDVAERTVSYHCRRLRSAGLVTFDLRRPRTIQLTDAGRAEL